MSAYKNCFCFLIKIIPLISTADLNNPAHQHCGLLPTIRISIAPKVALSICLFGFNILRCKPPDDCGNLSYPSKKALFFTLQKNLPYVEFFWFVLGAIG